jgi:hypothetical protein
MAGASQATLLRFVTIEGDEKEDTRCWPVPLFRVDETSAPVVPLHAVACGPLRCGTPGQDGYPEQWKEGITAQTSQKLASAKMRTEDVVMAVVPWPLGDKHPHVQSSPQYVLTAMQVIQLLVHLGKKGTKEATRRAWISSFNINLMESPVELHALSASSWADAFPKRSNALFVDAIMKKWHSPGYETALARVASTVASNVPASSEVGKLSYPQIVDMLDERDGCRPRSTYHRKQLETERRGRTGAIYRAVVTAAFGGTVSETHLEPTIAIPSSLAEALAFDADGATESMAPVKQAAIHFFLEYRSLLLALWDEKETRQILLSYHYSKIQPQFFRVRTHRGSTVPPPPSPHTLLHLFTPPPLFPHSSRPHPSAHALSPSLSSPLTPHPSPLTPHPSQVRAEETWTLHNMCKLTDFDLHTYARPAMALVAKALDFLPEGTQLLDNAAVSRTQWQSRLADLPILHGGKGFYDPATGHGSVSFDVVDTFLDAITWPSAQLCTPADDGWSVRMQIDQVEWSKTGDHRSRTNMVMTIEDNRPLASSLCFAHLVGHTTAPDSNRDGALVPHLKPTLTGVKRLKGMMVKCPANMIPYPVKHVKWAVDGSMWCTGGAKGGPTSNTPLATSTATSAQVHDGTLYIPITMHSEAVPVSVHPRVCEPVRSLSCVIASLASPRVLTLPHLARACVARRSL